MRDQLIIIGLPTFAAFIIGYILAQMNIHPLLDDVPDPHPVPYVDSDDDAEGYPSWDN
jgi:hypothetical protein